MAEENYPQIKDFKFVAHWSFSNHGQRIDKGELVWPANILHGKTIVRIVDTPKRGMQWGKSKTWYQLDEEGSPDFDTFDEFIKHYTPKEPTQPQPTLPIIVRVKAKPHAKKKTTGNKS